MNLPNTSRPSQSGRHRDARARVCERRGSSIETKRALVRGRRAPACHPIASDRTHWLFDRRIFSRRTLFKSIDRLPILPTPGPKCYVNSRRLEQFIAIEPFVCVPST
jgi:hypothetical protein